MKVWVSIARYSRLYETITIISPVSNPDQDVTEVPTCCRPLFLCSLNGVYREDQSDEGKEHDDLSTDLVFHCSHHEGERQALGPPGDVITSGPWSNSEPQRAVSYYTKNHYHLPLQYPPLSLVPGSLDSDDCSPL